MPRKPVDQLNAGRAYYAGHLPGLDVEYFAPLWHLFTVGHLVTTDLDAIARKFGCSFADFDLLGTLAMEEHKGLRATDLASTLYVSNAVVSTRIARLEKGGLLQRRKIVSDQRAFHLVVTEKGRALIDEAIVEIARNAKIVRFFQDLEPDDRAALARLLGYLHKRFDREFIGGPYTD